MDNEKKLQIIKEEFESKKPFDANFRFKCWGCSVQIEEGEEFFFAGEKKKICVNCLSELQEV